MSGENALTTGNDGFSRFGDSSVFALDIRLMKDPDGDDCAPAASVGSWGQWRLWVSDENLCAHDLRLDDGDQTRCDAVTWYLAPLFNWLAINWNPLLHEERLPGASQTAATARDAYINALSSHGADFGRFAPWQDWAARHSLRWAADGGLLPDIFLRRLGDDIEFSWGDRSQPGGEAAQFLLEPGRCNVPATAVATALDAALRWFQNNPALAARPWFADIAAQIEGRPSPESRATRLPWVLDARPEPGPRTDLFNRLRDRFAPLTEMAADPLCIGALSPAAAMFGAVTPVFSEEAAVRLLTITEESRIRGAETAKFPADNFAHSEPLYAGAHVWAQGYELARNFIDDAGALADDGHCVDLDALFTRLGIGIRQERLGGEGPRGVALAGSGLAPTIIVNVDYPMNGRETGSRFTKAHELCHILYDRDRARRVTHVSTPWAPAAVERRANAFAAMLLMPPELVQRLTPNLSSNVTLEDIADAAAQLGVGLRALIQHLANTDEISGELRDRLISELEDGPRPV